MRLQAESLAPACAPSAVEVNEDDALWTRLTEAATAAEFGHSWLSLQCQLLGNVRAGIVLLGHPNAGPFRIVAAWPDTRQPAKHLNQTAERALSERRRLVVKRDGENGQVRDMASCEIAYPIEVHGQLHGVAVLDLPPMDDRLLKAVMRQLQWGAGSLELLFARESLNAEIHRRTRLQSAFDLVAAAAGHDRFYAGALSFLTAIATRLDCSRVSLGFLRYGRAQVVAISHSAEFKKQTNLVRRIADVMDEAIDQQQSIVFPGPSDSPFVVRAHKELSQREGDACVYSIPFRATDALVGAVTLERPSDRPFDTNTIQLCQAVMALAGPYLELHHREDRWLPAKVLDSGRRYLAGLVGPNHTALKLGTTALAALVAFLMMAEGDYRVSARTVLEPIVQRTAAAPFDGYIREAPARAGDLVRAGDMLATLDDRELRLERLKALSRYQEYQKAHHKAMAERNAAQVEILKAQMQQVQAEIDLLDEQLRHARLTAPFDGIVASGDLSQAVGAPVEKGKVLFEIAPLNEYRVVLEVDERDIAGVAVGKQGQMMLTAFPHEPLPFAVAKVTPVSTAEDGRNFFRVEAQLTQPYDRLRPGMEGAGKIEIDRRRLIWIWTHQVVDWIRLAVWSWRP